MADSGLLSRSSFLSLLLLLPLFLFLLLFLVPLAVAIVAVVLASLRSGSCRSCPSCRFVLVVLVVLLVVLVLVVFVVLVVLVVLVLVVLVVLVVLGPQFLLILLFLLFLLFFVVLVVAVVAVGAVVLGFVGNIFYKITFPIKCNIPVKSRPACPRTVRGVDTEFRVLTCHTCSEALPDTLQEKTKGKLCPESPIMQEGVAQPVTLSKKNSCAGNNQLPPYDNQDWAKVAFSGIRKTPFPKFLVKKFAECNKGPPWPPCFHPLPHCWGSFRSLHMAHNQMSSHHQYTFCSAMERDGRQTKNPNNAVKLDKVSPCAVRPPKAFLGGFYLHRSSFRRSHWLCHWLLNFAWGNLSVFSYHFYT